MPAELIVVDDGSDVPVPGALRREHAGTSATLNAGIEAARGEWICWLSSDDEIDTGKLRRQLALTDGAGLLASYHSYRVKRAGVVTGNAYAKQWCDQAAQHAALIDVCPINGSTTMIHRRVFDAVGLYDTAYKYSQDWEMWCRIGCRYRWLGIKDMLGTRHEWDGNLTAKLELRNGQHTVRDEEDSQIRSRYSDPRLWGI